MYESITRKDLLTISQIRNTFAHAAVSVTFQTEEISNYCRRLKCIGEYIKCGIGLPLEEFSPEDQEPKVIFIATVYSIMIALTAHGGWSTTRKLALLSGSDEPGEMTLERLRSNLVKIGRHPFIP